MNYIFKTYTTAVLNKILNTIPVYYVNKDVTRIQLKNCLQNSLFFIFFISQYDVNAIREFFLFFFALTALFFSIIVLSAQNPVFSALALMATYVFSGFLLICLGLEIFGIYFILIYAGAISVLILFVIMMINLRFKEKTQEKKPTLVFFYWFFSITFVLGSVMVHFGVEHLANYLSVLMFSILDLCWLASDEIYDYRQELIDVVNIFPALFSNDFIFIVNLSLIILLIGMLGASFLVLASKKE